MQTIPLINLATAIIPILGIIYILYRWSLDWRHAIYGVVRMITQLLLIGYLLTYIFDTNSSLVVGAVLIVMISAASWIALGTVPEQRLQLYVIATGSISIAGGLTLILITQVVLSMESWYSPQQVIPLAGMIFASSMNSISLSAERLTAELGRGIAYVEARNIALNAALIPITNSLFAVGLVSLPGMMTGQILSGVSPFIASRYQLMVMCMMFAATGFSAILFLLAAKPLLGKTMPIAK